MRGSVLAGLLLIAAGCSSPQGSRDATPEPRVLGMNDLTILVPLPVDPGVPVVMSITGKDELLVPRGAAAALLDGIAAKTGGPIAFEDFHLVALRFDLCDRAGAQPCAEGDDGRLRLVFQPLYRDAAGATVAHDIALHAFYPVPAAELAGVIDQLRALAALQDAPTGPLAVSPALSAAVPPAGYVEGLTALIATYARWDRMVKLTVAGQEAESAAFAWIFRGFERVGEALIPIEIPDLLEHGRPVIRQTALLAGGDTVYNVRPVADAPVGFYLALNGQTFATASQAQQLAAVEALTAIQNPTLQDASAVQCISCHVATFLTRRRAELAGVDPLAVTGRFASGYDLTVDTIAGTDARVVRGLGWAATFPAISQRVANETAQVLAEIETRFPPR